MEFIKDYFSALVELTNEMSPYLILGFLIAGALHVFFPDEKVNKLLGASNFKSVFKAALIGIPLPLCSCGVIPTGVSFYKHGASKGATNSFLISTPQTGVDSIMVTYSLIGLPFAIVRVIVALITGLMGGIATNILENKKVEANTGSKISNGPKEKLGFLQSLYVIVKYAFFDFIIDIAKWLVVGLLIAALITVLVPEDFFNQYLDNSWLSMLVILAVSVPLYVCATGSVPIAAALLMKGLSPGAALVFLMAGPATNAATITVIGKVMGKRSLTAYLVSIISGALLFGFIIDTFLPAQWFSMFTNEHQHQHEVLPHWLQIASSVLLTFFLLYALVVPRVSKWFTNKETPSIDFNNLNLDNMNQIKISVKGMNCNHCKNNVENGLKQFDGIKDITADLNSESVTFSADKVNLDEVKNTIESLGYKYGGQL